MSAFFFFFFIGLRTGYLSVCNYNQYSTLKLDLETFWDPLQSFLSSPASPFPILISFLGLVKPLG